MINIIQILKKNDYIFFLLKSIKYKIFSSHKKNTVNQNIKFNYKKHYLNGQKIRRSIIKIIFKNIKFKKII